MHFYATSAQMAKDLAIGHDDVVDAAKDVLALYGQFASDNVQMFEIPVGTTNVLLAQMTEPGYNAVLFTIPIDAVPTDEARATLMALRCQLFNNRSPSMNALTDQTDASRPKPELSNQDVVIPGIRTRASIDENVRQQAETLIMSGKYDHIMAATFADIHRSVRKDIGDDPGYQNIRQYVIARRAQVGIKL